MNDTVATTADILRRLSFRKDIPPDVAATLEMAAELSILREHDCHRAGFTDGVNSEQARAGRGLIR